MQPRSHFDGKHYRNRYSTADHGAGWELTKFLWRMRTQLFRAPRLPGDKPDVAWLRANRSVDALTWIGHASFLLQVHGLNVVTDPHLTSRASPLKHAGPRRFNRPALDFADLPPLDIALISHNHYDHLDEGTVLRLAREHPGLRFVVPRGLKRWFSRRRITQVDELDWWQQAEVYGAQVHCVPVQHFSGRSATDRNQTLWCGLMLESRGKKILFAGDSGYSRDFRDIHAKYGATDLALLPIGAYEPRSFMRPVHVNPEEAVQIHQDLQARQSAAMHWGTFRLTLEPLDEPPVRLRAALKASNLPEDCFWVMRHGETRRLRL